MELEVIKNGAIIETIILNNSSSKEYLVLGRENDCSVDILLEHPSISRRHAIIQFSQDCKIFLYDLGSTWCTYINREKVAPFKYQEISNGDVIQFGESTRSYILNYFSEQDKVEEEEEENEREEDNENKIESKEKEGSM